MSEQGWREFLRADGVEDWVVLHGGPTAMFATKNFGHSAQLASEIAGIPGLEEGTAHISILARRVTIRLTREMWKTETKHIELAREISGIAKSLGAIADRSQVQEVQLAISAKPDAIDLEFWRAVLGYEQMLDDNAIDPLGTSSTVWMQEIDEHKGLKHAMHIDVSMARESVEARLAAAVAAGGVVVDSSHAPAWWILADRSGNKVCIVAWPDGAEEPDSAA